jgi:GntR family transcriptional regulator
MLPFRLTLESGESPWKQIVFAATRAILSGELREGDPFPSVREVSQALRVNPNTAHKAVAELIRQGLLEPLPGVGTVVARGNPAPKADQEALLAREVEALVVEARRLGISRSRLEGALRGRWEELFGDDHDDD